MGLLGSLLGSDGGSGQAAAAAEANRVNKQIYDQQRSDLSGYRDLGQLGLDQINNNLGSLTANFTMDNFQKDPGYDFRMQQGQQALERSAAARGGLLGGAALKQVARYGQEYASNEYDKAYNRFNQDRDQSYSKLMGLVGTGQNAAAQTGAAAQNYANAYGQNVTGAANAKAAAGMAEGSALMGLVGQGIGAYGMMSGASAKKATPVTSAPTPFEYNSPTFGNIGIKVSDRRLKRNIHRLAESKFKDVPTYEFEYLDNSFGSGKQIGVMAQDLLRLDPNHPAVVMKDGYYTVNYSMIDAEV